MRSPLLGQNTTEEFQKSRHSSLQVTVVTVSYNIPEVFFKSFWQIECYHKFPLTGRVVSWDNRLWYEADMRRCSQQQMDRLFQIGPWTCRACLQPLDWA